MADIEQFRTDMNAAETVSAVTKDKNHAHSIGITGTPFMIVGETFIGGYQDADYMKAVINSQAAKAKAFKTSAAPTATRWWAANPFPLRLTAMRCRCADVSRWQSRSGGWPRHSRWCRQHKGRTSAGRKFACRRPGRASSGL